MLEFPIIDSHLHLWDTNHLRYSWLDGDPILGEPHLLEQYNTATQGERVEQMVFVQAEIDHELFLQEAAWVEENARRDPRIAGIVAWAPLENGDAARPALEKLAANPRVKGIRRLIQDEPDIDFCLRPDFVKGVQALPDYGLHFEICIYHRHLANAIKLVEQCPEVLFMLDHIGKPNIKDHVLDPWREQLQAIAKFDNVWCKMSGLANEADWQRWTKEDLKPYSDHVIECFGFDRLVFGGDWPVVLRAARWQQWVDTLDWLTQDASKDERQKLFHDNASAFYRLS
ncbi:MAG TPA: amidohydrolase family protein [Phototrophicaceae bacterium]|nr:amidohydrolase family protein [Phototrophicaceae bacterium]